MNYKPYKHLPPFKGMVLQNFPFIEEDFDAITNYQLLCKVVEYLKNVIANELTMEENVTNLYNEFVNLKNYVDNYFTNLDVQEEINNKLDEMVESGELQNIIDEYFNNYLEFYAVAKSSATYIAKFKNGKTLFIDTGKSDQWDDIRNTITKLGITHFDYGIITHFHADHYGNLQNFIDNYLDSTSIIWVQMKPDFYNHSEDIKDSEVVYDNRIQQLVNAGITPIVPANDSYYEIDSNTKLHFLNTSREWELDYFGEITEYDDEGINFNHYSLVTEILHKEVSILATGDIERAVEEKIVNYIHQCEVMTAPHHMVNQDANLDFYRSAKAKWALGMYLPITNKTWLKEWNKSAIYLKENGAKLVTPQWSIPDNKDCFSFYSNGYVVNTTVRGCGDNPLNTTSLLYDRVEQAIDYSQNTDSDITLKHLVENMRRGSIMNIYIYTEFINQKVQLYNDLKSIFPRLGGGWVVSIQKGMTTGNEVGYCHMSATNGYINYVAKQNVNQEFNFKVTGYGSLQDINEETSLIETLNALPMGQYNAVFLDTQSKLLAHNGAYDLMIFKSSNINSVRISLLAILRDGNSNQHTNGIFAGHYNSNDTTPQIRWYRLGNSNYMGSANGMTQLINNIKGFRRGHYIMRYYQDDSGFLDTNAGYDLSINVSQSISENDTATAVVFATLRSTIPDNPNNVQVAVCYINATNETSSYVWHKLNN